MTSGKSLKLWAVNVVSFLLFSLLGLTGLLNWLVLPKGPRAGGGFGTALRHLLVEVHEWTAAAFILCILVHLALHWTYIKTNVRKYHLK